MQKSMCARIVLVAATLAVLTVGATDYTWQGGDGAFTNSAKWSPVNVPVDGDRAIFSTAGNGTVTWTGPVTNNEMIAGTFNGNTLALNLGGYGYTLTNRFYFSSSSASSYVTISNGFLKATNT